MTRAIVRDGKVITVTVCPPAACKGAESWAIELVDPRDHRLAERPALDRGTQRPAWRRRPGHSVGAAFERSSMASHEAGW